MPFSNVLSVNKKTKGLLGGFEGSFSVHSSVYNNSTHLNVPSKTHSSLLCMSVIISGTVIYF